MLSPGGRCTLIVIFKPSVAGSGVASLTTNHNATGSPLVITTGDRLFRHRRDKQPAYAETGLGGLLNCCPGRETSELPQRMCSPIWGVRVCELGRVRARAQHPACRPFNDTFMLQLRKTLSN